MARFSRSRTDTKVEYQKMTLPHYYNTVKEFISPLNDNANPVYLAGLRLKQIEGHITPCPIAEPFKEHQNAKRLAQEYLATIRSWNESIFFGALNSQRTLEERQQIIHNY